MDLAQVLHMNGGTGKTSYAENSFSSRNALSLAKPIIEEAIVNYCCNSMSQNLVIADLGCASGPSTLLMVSEVLKAVHNQCRRLGRQPPEFQVHFNDLPGNDFNSIFKSLPNFHEKLKGELGPRFSPCFFAGVPGSFYGRLFLTQSLHFVHSCYSLQWLSQVPKGVENNKGNICFSTTSPPNVFKAYKEQFQKDFSFFLKCRSEELVAGGKMVLTILGRKSEDLSSEGGSNVWELLATALNDMVSEGLIEEEKVTAFNVPQYRPCPSEVEAEVLKDGSFVVNRLEVSQSNWRPDESGEQDEHEYMAKCMRSVAEPLLVSHFGEGIDVEEAFRRFLEISADRMLKNKTQLINVTISLTKQSSA